MFVTQEAYSRNGDYSQSANSINCGNESAIKLVGNLVFHARSKHIETHYHFVQEKVFS